MLVSALALVLSFCSMSYELIISKAFYLIGINETTAYVTTVSVYMLGLGFGNLMNFNKEFDLKELINVEFYLTLLGAFSVMLIWFFGSYFEIMLSYGFIESMSLSGAQMLIFSLLQFFVVVIGYFSGKELCLLMFYLDKENLGESWILGLTYFGGLVSSFLITFVALPKFNEIESSFIIANINFVVMLFMTFKLYRFKIPIVTGVKLVSLSLLMAFLSGKLSSVSSFLVKAQYLDIKVVDSLSFESHKNILNQIRKDLDVERYRSKYQTIDIVHEKDSSFTLYLNKKPQFNSKAISGYHESMANGLINLIGFTPKNVLVLGGGDGILAKELIQNESIEEVTLIDLDPKIVELAKTHNSFLKINSDSFSNDKVNVLLGDAFLFLKENEKKWDAIFIDFPLPHTYDLTRLYSKEFYSLVKSRLSEKGGALFDAPLSIEIEVDKKRKISQPIGLLASTLKASGITNWMAFGPFEGFIFFNSQNERVSFNYDNLPSDISGAALVNLIELKYFYPFTPDESLRPNSIFSPRKFNVK